MNVDVCYVDVFGCVDVDFGDLNFSSTGVDIVGNGCLCEIDVVFDESEESSSFVVVSVCAYGCVVV